jgi:phytoene dehydrogenase-like protein
MDTLQQNAPRAIVVGGGIAGLIASIRLAQWNQNLSVSLYEKGESLGGRARTTHRDDVYFNQGPHALYIGGATHQSLKELGVAIRGKSPNPPKQFMVRGGRAYALPLTFANLIKTRGLSARAKWELLRFMSQLPELDWTLRQGCTVEDWLNESFRTAGVRDFLRLMIRLTTYCNDPHLQSAGVAIRQLQLGMQGGLYLDGGWQSLVDQLIQIAIEAGVIIHSHANVETIEVEQGRAVGIVLKDGEKRTGDAVIVATTLQEAARLIPATAANEIHERARRGVPVRMASLDIALEPVPRPKNAFALGMDKPVYLSNHSLAAKLSDRASVFHVAYYLSHEEDGQTVRPELESLLDLVQPGWRNVTAASRFLPNMLAASAVDDAASGGFVGRPEVAVAETRGLFVCGDWVGGEGLLVDASAASAERAAKLVLQLITEGGTKSPSQVLRGGLLQYQYSGEGA